MTNGDHDDDGGSGDDDDSDGGDDNAHASVVHDNIFC